MSGLQQRCEVFKCSFKVLTERRAIGDGDGSLARESTGASISLCAWKRRGKWRREEFCPEAIRGV